MGFEYNGVLLNVCLYGKNVDMWGSSLEIL